MHAEVLTDPTLRLVMDSVLSTLMNVVGSVKAIYKYTRDLEYYATRDPLTELFNQRVFWELLTYERLRAQRHGYPFALLLVDVDNFKLINDGYGHGFGDSFLQEFTRAMRGALRVGDIFARYGGDEFAIILPETDLEQARAVAQRMLDAADAMDVEAPDGSRIRGAASIGIGVFPDHADEIRDLFLFADNMMYKAKEEGKNRIGVPTAEDVVTVFQGITQKSVLILKALEEQRVVPFFQPIVDVRTHEVAAYEVLSRIELDGRIVGAGEFVEIAEKIGVIHRLDMLVMERALEEIASQEHQGKVFLNLSPRALVLSEFGRAMTSIVANSGIPPERIVFEITESYNSHSLEQMEFFSRRLRALGLRIAVDDLGSGIASLAHMSRLSPDFFKVDRSLVQDVHRRPYQAALLNALAVFAERMRVGYIVEGIETTQELQTIIDADVPWGQGFIFGEPEPLVFPGAY